MFLPINVRRNCNKGCYSTNTCSGPIIVSMSNSQSFPYSAALTNNGASTRNSTIIGGFYMCPGATIVVNGCLGGVGGTGDSLFVLYSGSTAYAWNDDAASTADYGLFWGTCTTCVTSTCTGNSHSSYLQFTTTLSCRVYGVSLGCYSSTACSGASSSSSSYTFMENYSVIS